MAESELASLEIEKGKNSIEGRELLRSSGSGFASSNLIRSGSAEFSTPSERINNSIPNKKWWKEITKYQWLVLSACWLGWLFDVLDSKIYTLVQSVVLKDLLGDKATQDNVGFYSGVIFCIYLMGWALGGIIFGILADYYGRVKMMIATIVIYSIFASSSAFSQSLWQLCLFRFLSAIGTGGEWALGATLVHEEWPEYTTAIVGSILQCASAVGYFLAAILNVIMSKYSSWRVFLGISVIPALLAFLLRFKIRESESWLEYKSKRDILSTEKKKTCKDFTLFQLFYKKNIRDTLVGSTLALVAICGSWAGVEWSPTIIRENFPGADVESMVSTLTISMMVGALIGYLTFGPIADRFGRKPAFGFFTTGNIIFLPLTYLVGIQQTNYWVLIFVLFPFLGFFSYGLFSGFPIYLPELFPIAFRTTAVGFCFNIGRMLSAWGPIMTGVLIGKLGSYTKAASAASAVYVVALIALFFARETKVKNISGDKNSLEVSSRLL